MTTQAGNKQRNWRARRERERAAARQLQALYDNKQNIGHRKLTPGVPVPVPKCMTYFRLYR